MKTIIIISYTNHTVNRKVLPQYCSFLCNLKKTTLMKYKKWMQNGNEARQTKLSNLLYNLSHSAKIIITTSYSHLKNPEFFKFNET